MQVSQSASVWLTPDAQAQLYYRETYHATNQDVSVVTYWDWSADRKGDFMTVYFNGSEITVLAARRANHGVFSSTFNGRPARAVPVERDE